MWQQLVNLQYWQHVTSQRQQSCLNGSASASSLVLTVRKTSHIADWASHTHDRLRQQIVCTLTNRKYPSSKMCAVTTCEDAVAHHNSSVCACTAAFFVLAQSCRVAYVACEACTVVQGDYRRRVLLALQLSRKVQSWLWVSTQAQVATGCAYDSALLQLLQQLFALSVARRAIKYSGSEQTRVGNKG